MIKKFSQKYREDVEWPALQAFALKAFGIRLEEWMSDGESAYPITEGRTLDPFVYEDGAYHVQVLSGSGSCIAEWRIVSYDPGKGSVEIEKLADPADRSARNAF